MNLPDVLDEIFGVLEDVPGLNVPSTPGVLAKMPSPSVELPAVVYGDQGPGLDRITDLVLMIVFGQPNNAQVFRSALEYASTSGARSIRAALQGHSWSSCSTFYVRSAEPIVDTFNGHPGLAYAFHIDITGRP